MTHILFVEDAQDLAQAVVRELEKAGYRVTHITHGEAALQHLANHQVDLVILDWMLPSMDGLDVLRNLRQSSAVPVLMLTARREEMDRVIGLEVGADDYLTKPFSMRELIARVRALLRRIQHVEQILQADRQPGSVALQWGALRLDPASHMVTMEGQPLELTSTEFNLLQLLVRNPGRVFSRAYLLEAVWGESYIPGDRSVDNAVLRLRRKLGAHGEKIETVFNVGYRLQAEP